MRRRANRLMGGGRTVLFDAFAAPDGTILPDHAGAGVRWNRHVLFTPADAAIGDASIDSGAVHNANSNIGRYYHAGRRRRRYGRVECDFVQRTDNDEAFGAVVLLLHPTMNTMIYGRYNTSGDIWQIIRVRDGAQVSLGTSAQDLTNGQVYRLAMERRGPRFLLWRDGTLLINADDPGNREGVPGMRFGGSSSPTVGVNLDNWMVTR